MMMIKDHDKEFLFELEEVFLKRHNEFKNSGLKLDLTRGKQSPTQLNLSKYTQCQQLLQFITAYTDVDGLHCHLENTSQRNGN